MSGNVTAQNINSSDAHENLAETREQLAKTLGVVLEKRAEFVQQSFRRLDHIEDMYRSFGKAYHQTNLEARRSSRLSAESRNNLYTAFTDFNVWFGPIAEAQQLLKQLLLECQPNGTLKALRERDRLTKRLKEEITNRDITTYIDAIEEDLISLVNEDERLFSNGEYPRWYEPTRGEHGFTMPVTRGEEWKMFQQWVYTFPETRKSLFDNGRPLDMLTSEALYKTIEDYDSYWGAH